MKAIGLYVTRRNDISVAEIKTLSTSKCNGYVSKELGENKKHFCVDV